jgi:hypothetical protein
VSRENGDVDAGHFFRDVGKVLVGHDLPLGKGQTATTWPELVS